MSSRKPETRVEFKEYCLRRLGKPVIQINVADPQVEDLIDEGIEYFHRNHYDGTIQLYLPMTVTEQVMQDKFFEVDDSIIGINNLLESTIYTNNQFSVEWQMIASAMPFALKGDGLLTYDMAMTYREQLKMSISGKTKPIRFNRHMNRVYVDMDWSQIKVGKVFVVECFRTLDPEEFPEVWNDPFLKKYVTALVKRQWGNNLRKLRNVEVLGGVMIDAESILQEAEAEIKELEDAVLTEYSEPVDLMMG